MRTGEGWAPSPALSDGFAALAWDPKHEHLHFGKKIVVFRWFTTVSCVFQHLSHQTGLFLGQRKNLSYSGQSFQSCSPVAYLKSIHPTIKFTREHPITSDPFLNVNIQHWNNKIETDLFASLLKDTNTFYIQEQATDLFREISPCSQFVAGWETYGHSPPLNQP